MSDEHKVRISGGTFSLCLILLGILAELDAIREWIKFVVLHH